MPTLEDLFEGSARRRAAMEELYDLIESDPALRRVLESHGADRSTLRELEHFLSVTGCGMWVRGHWIATSALAFPASLDFVLKHRNASTSEEVEFIGAKLFEYFHRGRVGLLH